MRGVVVNRDGRLSDGDRTLLDAGGFTDYAAPLQHVDEHPAEPDDDPRSRVCRSYSNSCPPIGIHCRSAAPCAFLIPTSPVDGSPATPLEWL